MKDLSKKLTNLRESKGWTKTFVANKLGIKSLSTYANYEYGIREPDMETIVRIAELYEVSVDYLLGRTEHKDFAIVQGEEINLGSLTEYQRIILDWAMSKESLSFIEDKEELASMLDTLSVVFEHEKRKKRKKDL